MLRTPKIYKLIAALVLVATCPIAGFAADDYFPSLAEVAASTPTAEQVQPANSPAEENIKKIKDIEIHGLNVIS